MGMMSFKAWVQSITRRRRARSEQPPIYAVGSPEYNQQIVAALRQVNERLEPQGKRVPERAAIEIIKQHQEESEWHQ